MPSFMAVDIVRSKRYTTFTVFDVSAVFVLTAFSPIPPDGRTAKRHLVYAIFTISIEGMETELY